ncbi:MAG: ammonium transporter [Actinomycetota bacterium]|nr:ammonium transporter [Actinomycetota bacterium]
MNVNSGDTAWLLVCAALVMFMTPGLAFFYGGLVRSKNVVGTIMQSFIALGLVTVLWALIGFSLAFGPDKAGLIGGLDFLGLRGVGAAPSAYAPTVPATSFMVFQMMFAIITPALIAGAFAERMRFSGYLTFVGLWSILVYAPVTHWVWGGGFLGADGLGALDFAGGAVVHANAGAAALATAIYLGRRRGHGSDDMSPHNVPFVILGAGILWFGWFGFNAGSALTSGALASSAFVNTQLGAAAALLGWIILERVRTGKVTTIGAATGAVAGLATITPAAGYVPPMAAIAIGLAAGIVCYLAVGLKGRFGYDDSLDVVGVHMVGGILGVMLTGVFASLAINAAGAAASLAQVGKQAVLAGATVVFSFVVTMAILKVTDLTVGLRVTEEHEDVGLDASQHGEVGYRL